MAAELLKVLTADLVATEKAAPELDDRALWSLYEALTLTRTLDEQLGVLQQAGGLGFWVPSGEAAAVAVGAASALSDRDWYFPGLRDAGAFLVRGGSLEQYLAQVVGNTDDPARGRSVAGQACLPDGRFVHTSGSLGAHVQQAVGAALAMKIRDDDMVALASFGSASLSRAAVMGGLETAARTQAPVVFVCRTSADVAGTAELKARAFGVEVVQADGTDVLAVLKAVRRVREAALAEGPRLVLVRVVPTPGETAADAAPARLRPFLGHRGLWDPGREEELQQRCASRVAEALEAAQVVAMPAADSLFDDVYATRTWMLQEQSENLRRNPS